ncbi:MAG: lipoyl synthase [Bacteroidales bacterium]|jgi:lipoic acid synthetase|nr:lipoyl synthase [Bacteroidales bacterium]
MVAKGRKPGWLKIRLPQGEQAVEVGRIIRQQRLHTICSSGLCPNQGECWGCGTATFMICGEICTRSCRFCHVKTGRPEPPDPEEPGNIARSVQLLKLKHAVITSVDRDDLPDLGAAHWVKVIKAVKAMNPGVTMEVLIPDFQEKTEWIDMIIEASPEVVSHNLETVRRLSKHVRSRATYDGSLNVIRRIASSGKVVAKSGIMLGLGETRSEILETMDDLLRAGCRVMTVGQYLQPSGNNIPVTEYIQPEIFSEYRQIGQGKGFACVESAPLVRSSYHAEKHVHC